MNNIAYFYMSPDLVACYISSTDKLILSKSLITMLKSNKYVVVNNKNLKIQSCRDITKEDNPDDIDIFNLINCKEVHCFFGIFYILLACGTILRICRNTQLSNYTLQSFNIKTISFYHTEIIIYQTDILYLTCMLTYDNTLIFYPINNKLPIKYHANPDKNIINMSYANKNVIMLEYSNHPVEFYNL